MNYDRANAFIETEISERLPYIIHRPKHIVCVGNPSDPFLTDLKRRYKKATLYILEPEAFCDIDRQQPDTIIVLAQPETSEHILTLCETIGKQLPENGLFMLGCFGLGTADESRTFYDMHDVGDALLKANLHNPVVDVERLNEQGTPYEIVFAHGWGKAPKRQEVQKDGSIKIKLSQLFTKKR